MYFVFTYLRVCFKNYRRQVKVHLGDQRDLFDEDSSKLRWFTLPSEAFEMLSTPSYSITQVSPFQPLEYLDALEDKSKIRSILEFVENERRSDSNLVKRQANDSQKSLIDYLESGFKDKSKVKIPELPETPADDYVPPEKREKVMSCPLRVKKREPTTDDIVPAISKWYSPPKSIFKPMIQVS